MSSRAANRAAAQKAASEFVGRVRKFKLRWTEAGQDELQGDEVRLELLQWVGTSVLSEQPAGPRHPHLRPVPWNPDMQRKPIPISGPHAEAARAEAQPAPLPEPGIPMEIDMTGPA